MRIQAFNFSINLMRSILWQYESAPNMIALAKNDQTFIDTQYSEFWTDWHKDVFDLNTANEFGLAVWARILNIQLEFESKRRVTEVWGFGINNKNFENGGFGIADDSWNSWDLESARILLKLRWFQITMRPTISNINYALTLVFGENVVFAYENYDMSITYVFRQEPNYRLKLLLQNTDMMPRPSGVKVSWMVQYRNSWGYGIHHLNFENGNFGV